MKIMVNIEKKYAYIIMGLLILTAGFFVVYALAPSIDTSQGYHESDQVSVSVSGTEKTLQEAIDGGGFIPSGAVMAFDLSSCPLGWTELTTARGRVIVGLNTADTSFDVLGEIGGEKTHTLTIAEMPSHTHRFIAYTYAYSGDTDLAGAGWDDPRANNNVITESTGGSQPHNNLQPYITFIYCRKN